MFLGRFNCCFHKHYLFQGFPLLPNKYHIQTGLTNIISITNLIWGNLYLAKVIVNMFS